MRGRGRTEKQMIGREERVAKNWLLVILLLRGPASRRQDCALHLVCPSVRPLISASAYNSRKAKSSVEIIYLFVCFFTYSHVQYMLLACNRNKLQKSSLKIKKVSEQYLTPDTMYTLNR